MSLSAIKDWFANVDISDTDWRIRWPLFILPFLLLALLYTLFRANQLSGVQSQAAIDLQAMVQNGPATSNASNLPIAANQFEQGMAGLASNATQLQVWLAQGRNTEEFANHADALARMVAYEQENAGALPDVEFWNAFSDVLAILEKSVIDGQIKTPESRALIDTLRLEYAELRTTQFTTAGLDANGQLAQGPDAANTQHLQTISGGMTRLREQRAQITRLHNRAFVLSALASALFVMLLWGLWRNAQRTQQNVAGRNRHEQSAILRLLDEITPLANGDLRVKATVSEASTGAIADAFNYAVEELRRLVKAVTHSADLVRSSVHETRESAHHLARASSVQAREIHRSSNYLNVMSDTMAQLSAHAVESSRIADLSVQQAHAGNEAVQANVDALSRIRTQAESTSRLMQRLVETSAAINERVNDIQVVAKRTDLLALNATIRSSAQISHGVFGNNAVSQGAFTGNGSTENLSMLSDDIAHLADTLGRASRDISNLSDLIQQDATITLNSMVDTMSELDDGQRTALQASDSLHEIDRVSNELNGLISDIASKSLRQAGVVKQLSANMGVINNITRDSTVQLQDSAKSLKELQEVTAELRDSVSDFKLPRDPAVERRLQIESKRTAKIQSKVARPKAAKVPVKHA